MKNLLSVICILIVLTESKIANAKTDSLVRWIEIQFTTPFERNSFSQSLKENRTDFLKLFLSNSTTADQDYKYFKDRFDHTLTEIKSSEA